MERLLTRLRTGDTVYIYKLDRLGRLLRHLLKVVGDLQQLGVGLISLIYAIKTTSAQSWLVFNLFASLAEFERELIREGTHAGLASARARGRVGGRQRGLSEEVERTAIIAETSTASSSLASIRLLSACTSPKLPSTSIYATVKWSAHRKPVSSN